MAFEAFKKQEEENKDEQQPENIVNPISSGGGSSTAPSTGGGPTQSQAAGQRQGSGRYTNLKKYLEANKGGASRLSAGIQGQFQRTINPYAAHVQQAESGVQSGIGQSRDALDRGNQFLSQLQSSNFDPNLIASNDEQLRQFAGFRTSQGVDEQALTDQNKEYRESADQMQKLLQGRMKEIGTEDGRFGLLAETFGGRGLTRPTYSTGQQRLDQLLLQSGGGNQVGKLQGDISQRLAGVQAAQQQAQKYGQDIGGLQEQEGALVQGLGTQTKALEDQFIKGLTQKMNAANYDYTGRQQDIRNALRTGGKKMSARTLQDLGLNPNVDQTYVWTGLQGITDPTQLVNFGTGAQSYKDVADQGDVDRYNQLAKLAYGSFSPTGEYVAPDASQLALTGVGKVPPAVEAIAGQGGMSKAAELADQARGKMIDQLNKKNTDTQARLDQLNYDRMRTLFPEQMPGYVPPMTGGMPGWAMPPPNPADTPWYGDPEIEMRKKEIQRLVDQIKYHQGQKVT